MNMLVQYMRHIPQMQALSELARFRHLIVAFLKQSTFCCVLRIPEVIYWLHESKRAKANGAAQTDPSKNMSCYKRFHHLFAINVRLSKNDNDIQQSCQTSPLRPGMIITIKEGYVFPKKEINT